MPRRHWADDDAERLVPGTRVALRSDPARRGSVTLVLHENDRERYLVTWDDGGVGDLIESALVRE